MKRILCLFTAILMPFCSGSAQTAGFSKLYTNNHRVEIGRLVSIGDQYIEFVTYTPDGFRSFNKWNNSSIYKIISPSGNVEFTNNTILISAEEEQELGIFAERRINYFLSKKQSILQSKVKKSSSQNWEIHFNNGTELKDV